MSSPAPIVVAIGVDDPAGGALEYAAGDALRSGRPLVLVHVLPAGQHIGWVDSGRREAGGRRRLDQAASRARELTRGLIEVSVALEIGSAAHALIRHSQAAHLLVVQRPAAIDGVEPPLTHALAVRSAAPLVVVPPFWRAGDTHARIEICFDDPSASGPAIVSGMAAASALGATTELVHTWRCDPTGLPHRTVSEALAEASQGAELMVVTRRGSTPSRLSTTTRAALDTADCPVLVVAPGQHHDVVPPRRRFSLVRGA